MAKAVSHQTVNVRYHKMGLRLREYILIKHKLTYSEKLINRYLETLQETSLEEVEKEIILKWTRRLRVFAL